MPLALCRNHGGFCMWSWLYDTAPIVDLDARAVVAHGHVRYHCQTRQWGSRCSTAIEPRSCRVRRFGSGALVEPIADVEQVDTRGGGEMLHVRFRLQTITR